MSDWYRAHPSFGLRPASWRPPRLFGEERTPIAWMGLPAETQVEQERRFVGQAMSFLADRPALYVHARYGDPEIAARQAATFGLPPAGPNVHGPIPAGQLDRLLDVMPIAFEIESNGRSLVSSRSDELGVGLCLEPAEKDELERTLRAAGLIDSDLKKPSRAGTRQAMMLVVLDYVLLAVVVLTGVLVMHVADRYVGWVLALALGIIIGALLGFPLSALGRTIRRWMYESP